MYAGNILFSGIGLVCGTPNIFVRWHTDQSGWFSKSRYVLAQQYTIEFPVPL